MSSSPSSISTGPASNEAELIGAPRLTGVCHAKSSLGLARKDTQMSFMPRPPVRSLAKNIQCPSREKLGTASCRALFTVGPRFTGMPHSPFLFARCETQRSARPRPPGLFEAKYRLFPSCESPAPKSANGELTVVPRFIGADQAPNLA